MYNSQFNFPPNGDFKFLLIDLLHSRTKNIEISYRVMNSIDNFGADRHIYTIQC